MGGTLQDPETGRQGGRKVGVGEEWVEVVSAADTGYLFINAVA